MSSNNTALLSIDEAAQRVILVHLNKLKEEVNLLPNYVDLKHLCSELLFCIDQVQISCNKSIAT